MLNKIRYVFRKPSDRLTPREWEVVIAICFHNLDEDAAAERLYVYTKTIQAYLSHIYNKLNVRGIDELREWYNDEYPPTGLHARDYEDDES